MKKVSGVLVSLRMIDDDDDDPNISEKYLRTFAGEYIYTGQQRKKLVDYHC